jgi:phage-related protein (TIGR01555 family)
MFSLEERNDSWQNLLSGLGSGRDKSTHTHLSPNDRFQPDYLEQLYINDDIVARICDLLPSEILRQGFSTKVDDEDFAWNGLSDILRDALVKARIFGAAFIYIGADDGQAQEQVLSLAKIRGVRFLNVLSPKDLSHQSFFGDAQQANFGQPELYRLNGSAQRQSTGIHSSRLIPFFGTLPLSPRQFPPSILQRIYPVLQQFHTAWQATAHLMTDAAQGIFKLKGLHSAVASNRSEELLKRMELVDMSRSISRSILLDAEDEEFRRDSYGFAGIPEILEKMMLRLAAAARLPVSLLMGQAPAGMNATGESDTRFFYDQVRAEQEALKPKIERLIKIKVGDESAKVSIDFPALWQMTDREKAELRRMEAETDRIYLQEGVLLPEEVAIKRFSSGDFTIELSDRAELASLERSTEYE